jgi:hypothetical protein
MKRLIASAGLVAVSATGLYGQDPAETRMITTKPWTVSAALRGFYDDNIISAPNLSGRTQDSYGIEVRPNVAVKLNQENQTIFSASYTYDMKYYEARDTADNDPIDHSHEAEFRLLHRFSPQYQATLSDSFVYTQEPQLIAGQGVALATFRQDLSAIRNRGAAEVMGQFTDLFGVAVGYENTYYDFLEDNGPAGFVPLSTLLNRDEHIIRLDGRWKARTDLVGILGYQYGRVDYLDDTLLPGFGLKASDRSSQAHYAYVGAEYTFTQKLSAKGRVGGVFTEYDKLDMSAVSPFADVSGTYRYAPGSSVQLGVRQERNATDQYRGPNTATFGTSALVLDQDSTVVYGVVRHRITPRIFGSVLGQYQRSVYNGGDLDSLVDDFYTLGLNLEYKITSNFSAETGYNYDRLDSDLGSVIRSFTRNRVYVGLRAQY